MMTAKQLIFDLGPCTLTESVNMLKKSEDIDYLLSILRDLKNELDYYSIPIPSLEILKTMSFYLDPANREKIEIPGELRDFIFRVYDIFLDYGSSKAQGKETRQLKEQGYKDYAGLGKNGLTQAKVNEYDATTLSSTIKDKEYLEDTVATKIDTEQERRKKERSQKVNDVKYGHKNSLQDTVSSKENENQEKNETRKEGQQWKR